MRARHTVGGIRPWSDPSRSAASYYRFRGPCPGLIPEDYVYINVSQSLFSTNLLTFARTQPLRAQVRENFYSVNLVLSLPHFRLPHFCSATLQGRAVFILLHEAKASHYMSIAYARARHCSVPPRLVAMAIRFGTLP